MNTDDIIAVRYIFKLQCQPCMYNSTFSRFFCEHAVHGESKAEIAQFSLGI